MVKTIKFKDREYPVRINYRTSKNLVTKLGRHEPDKGKVHDFEYWEHLMYFAIQEGCRIEGAKFDLSMEDILDIFDQQFEDSISMLMSFTPPEEGAGLK